jgi:hypothetical protein
MLYQFGANKHSARYAVKRLFLLIAAGACASCVANGSSVRPLRPLEIAVAPWHDGGTDQVLGALQYEGSCLLVREDVSGRLLHPVWPIGTTFNGTSVMFHRPAKADTRVVIPEETFFTGTVTNWASLPELASRPFETTCGALPFLVTTVTPAN